MSTTPLGTRSQSKVGASRPKYHCAYKMLRNPRYECPRAGKMYQELWDVHYCAFHDSYAMARCQAFFEHLHAGMRCSEIGLVVDPESGRKFCAKHDPRRAVEFSMEPPARDAEPKKQPEKCEKPVPKKLVIKEQRNETVVRQRRSPQLEKRPETPSRRREPSPKTIATKAPRPKVVIPASPRLKAQAEKIDKPSPKDTAKQEQDWKPAVRRSPTIKIKERAEKSEQPRQKHVPTKTPSRKVTVPSSPKVTEQSRKSRDPSPQKVANKAQPPKVLIPTSPEANKQSEESKKPIQEVSSVKEQRDEVPAPKSPEVSDQAEKHNKPNLEDAATSQQRSEVSAPSPPELKEQAKKADDHQEPSPENVATNEKHVDVLAPAPPKAENLSEKHEAPASPKNVATKARRFDLPTLTSPVPNAVENHDFEKHANSHSPKNVAMMARRFDVPTPSSPRVRELTRNYSEPSTPKFVPVKARSREVSVPSSPMVSPMLDKPLVAEPRNDVATSPFVRPARYAASRNSICVIAPWESLTMSEPRNGDEASQRSESPQKMQSPQQIESPQRSESPQRDETLQRPIYKRSAASRNSVCVITPREPLTDDLPVLRSPGTPAYHRIAFFEAAMAEENKDRIAKMYRQCNICLEPHKDAWMNSVPDCGHRYSDLCLIKVRRNGTTRKYNCSSCRDFIKSKIDG